MKLKKIASLALAGLMAVSMLAACGGDNSTNNGGASSESTTSTGIVSALNNEQDTIDFVSDSTLSSNLEKAVKAMTNKISAAQLSDWINKLTGVAEWNNNSFYGEGAPNQVAFDGRDSLDKVNPVTMVMGYVVDNALTEEYAVTQAAKALAEEIDELKADDIYKDGRNDAVDYVNNRPLNSNNNKYHTYDYTGKVSMTSVKNSDGTTYYYFVMVVTQTITEQEWKA